MMEDLTKKVIGGVAACANMYVTCGKCPYKEHRDSTTGKYCVTALLEDTLEVLKQLTGGHDGGAETHSIPGEGSSTGENDRQETGV